MKLCEFGPVAQMLFKDFFSVFSLFNTCVVVSITRMNMFGVIHSEVFTVGLYFLMSMVRYNIIKLQAGHLFLTTKMTVPLSYHAFKT